MRFQGYLVADVCEETSQEVMDLIVSGDGNPSCGARQGMFCTELIATHTLPGEVGR